MAAGHALPESPPEPESFGAGHERFGHPLLQKLPPPQAKHSTRPAPHGPPSAPPSPPRRPSVVAAVPHMVVIAPTNAMPTHASATPSLP